MSLPGLEVLIEKLLPKILGRLGKENPSKKQCKVAFVQRKIAVTSTVSVRFLYARATNQAKNLIVHACSSAGQPRVLSVCMHSGTINFVCVPTAVLYATKCCVTSHDTSTGLLGTFQASNIGE